MKTLKLGVCFFNESDEVVCKRTLSGTWNVNQEEILQSNHSLCMQEEVANILIEQLKLDLTNDVVKGMLDEMYEKEKENEE